MNTHYLTQRLEKPYFHNRMQARYERSLRWCKNLIVPPEVAALKKTEVPSLRAEVWELCFAAGE